MDDAAYLFRQTEIDRKRTGRGIYARKGGSHSKKCSLPSDHLTAKQRKELNGPVQSVCLTKPMAWSDFKALHRDVKLLYLRECAERHKARLKDVAEMFGITPNSLSIYITQNIGQGSVFPRTGKRTPSSEWLDFLAQSYTATEEVSAPAEEEIVQEEPISAVKPGDLAELSSGELIFTGNLFHVCTKLTGILEPKGVYRLTIGFQKIESS